MNGLLQTLILIILLIMSAFFSGSETAFFSLNYVEREKLSKNTSIRLRRFIRHMLNSSDEMLITILTGNMLVNIFASSLSETLGSELLQINSDIITIAVMTVVLLLFGEMSPKNLAVQNSLAFSRFALKILYYIYILLYPITKSLNIVKELFLSVFPKQEVQTTGKKAAILRSAIQIGLREKVISDYEYKILDSFIDFRNEFAEDVMIPRNQIFGFDIKTDISDMLSKLQKLPNSHKYSLIPAYRGDLDHIAGYIDVKELIDWKINSGNSRTLFDYIKPVHPVPETKLLSELVKEMRSLNIGMALIVDEYGGTAGVITFQNLIEDLFDYFYHEKNGLIREIAKNKYRIAGECQIKDVEQLIKIELASESKTLAGFILEKLGEIPRINDSVEIENILFRVLRMKNNRILEVECIKEKTV
ncbi:MAG: HlyC/CorC family transporter [Spirochaetales bacterium]|nr:HlyC/CorC family transporter [Spirochaetales bacterium]